MGMKSRVDRTIGDGTRSYVFPTVADYGNWQTWREPEKPLHIDKFITAFASLKPGRRNSGKLRSPQDASVDLGRHSRPTCLSMLEAARAIVMMRGVVVRLLK